MSEIKEYNFKKIEEKWQKKWLEDNDHSPDFSKINNNLIKVWLQLERMP